VTSASGEVARRGVFLSQAVQGDKDALDAFARAEPHRTIMRRVRPWAKTATFRFWTADAARLTPDRLWAEAERRISPPRA
jgi:hypothetical protein